ncbi:MAG: zinc ribbon domain-containing protein [Oscillibacter sp.]|nr:zinc ribbon domain-containing protein [Oscillibacter sp.]
MKRICKYCGESISESEAFCPNCGAKNAGESGGPKKYRKPQTIEELKAFCADKGMPLEKMRFFIGENYRGARAFGIYQDTDGEFVVYKNKSDGSRAVRYKGPDEAYAVNEIYEKLRSEDSARRQAPVSRSAPIQKKSGHSILLKFFMMLCAAQIVVIFAVILLSGSKKPHRGYYAYNDHDYYYYSGDWYYYDDDILGWRYAYDVDPYLEENHPDYFLDDDYDAGYGVSNFEDSEYWYGSDYGSDTDDYDWGSSSDYDSWDSFDTDWDSDW